MNQVVPRGGDLDLLLFDWPTKPTWLYALNQGSHTIIGLIVVPLILVKLWSVFPKLFSWPPVKSPAHALERVSILFLVGGAGVHVGHRPAQQPALVPVALQLRRGPLLRRLGLHRGVAHPRRDEVHHDPHRLPRAGRSQAADGRRRPHRGGALRARRPCARSPRGGDDLPARAARAHRRHLGRAVRRHRRPVHRRAAALDRAARPARPGHRRAAGLPGQQDRAAGAASPRRWSARASGSSSPARAPPR